MPEPQAQPHRQPARRIVNISVREVVEFVLRTGGLAGNGQFAGPTRALEGTRAHIKLQKSRPADYQSEVAVTREIDAGDFILKLRGRIDGLREVGGILHIEEIKTVRTLTDSPADPVHLGQAKLYAALYSTDRNFTAAEIQITYLELGTMRTREITEHCAMPNLRSFFDTVLGEYLDFLRAHHAWMRTRDQSISEANFPFRTYRAGQRSLAVAVYRTIKSGGKLFAEAPTGIGKTISVLFPAIKAMGQGSVEKIFYTTAKTVGRTVAEKALEDLRTRGLRLRSVTLTAKEKICFNDGKPCDLTTCPFAIVYYDRIKAALQDAFACDTFTREQIEALARKHQVCPFELSLDLSVWADAVICDYNYVFDPSVSLKRFFGDEKRDFAILIDEAHNLVDRAREMFSAELRRGEVTALRDELDTELPACAKLLKRIHAQFAAFRTLEGTTARGESFVNASHPPKLTKVLKDFCAEAESWLARNEPAGFKESLLDFYFKALAFVRTDELYDERYSTTYEPHAQKLKLFCVDPSKSIRDSLARVGASVFFSATLNPIDYFRESLGGNMTDVALKLASPFPRENLLLLVQDRIATNFRARTETCGAVAEAIAAAVRAKPGNYLVFFPSYEYMTRVLEAFSTRYPDITSVTQKTGMSESEREEFLSLFNSPAEQTLVAFAVLGGIFGEGIDLVGDRLIGVIVIGIGLPQICLERDLIREYWQNAGRSGFDYAYTFPGMNRVLQAVGRLIRTETDRGTVLLIDDRFVRPAQRKLFPVWWETRIVRTDRKIQDLSEAFWNSAENSIPENLEAATPECCKP
ncbi:MAG TPA: helicase C-terminal domain-containing protein [Verrucomicrobiae bacterium]